MHKLEYLWLDGCSPTQIRSKTRVVKEFGKKDAPIWGFDGSSTQQADGNNSDCVLKPVRYYPNPLEVNSSIVLCEVWDTFVDDYGNDRPHETNTRKLLEETITELEGFYDEWVGFEQEYTLFKHGRPMGWPSVGEPPPQGDYYCGRNIGEKISREHLNACIDAGIQIFGTNAEVMLGQWEYQIGPGGSIAMSDDLWVARWLLERICEKHEVVVSLHPKPIEGDWNGAGCHTNFSTNYMRDEGGYLEILNACENLSKVSKEHLKEYGEYNEKRLTGEHETCSIEEFRYGVSDRGASIRIPWQVERDGRGYLEDRRPSSNCDPYKVSARLIKTICK